jgi:RHS repeat-associated protein
VEVGRYDYDRNLQRVKRKTTSENVEYVLDDKYVLQEASGSDSTHPSYRRYRYGKEPLAVVDSGQSLRFLSVDALGSVADVTTTSGTVYQARQYDAWGQYRNGTAPFANQPKLGYTGRQFDPETGLVYARARYYDAETGVFLSRDSYEGTLADAPSLHRFAHAWANPLRFWDMTGLCAEGQDEGCQAGLLDTLKSAYESATSDTTYADARARRLEQNYKAYQAEQREQQVEEAENGPGTVARIKEAVGEAVGALASGGAARASGAGSTRPTRARRRLPGSRVARRSLAST